MSLLRLPASLRPHTLVAAATFGLALVPTLLWAQPCTVPDVGSGTVTLPPPGCPYVSPMDFHMIVNGLPPGTTIIVGTEHSRFVPTGTFPGGSLGGERETFNSDLRLNLQGTGSLAGFNRMIVIPAQCETHVGPRTPFDPVQSFDTDMFRIQGQIVGDPDFDLLRITAGTSFGMPSPGHTTLTKVGGNWNVDSFFDITYRIDFVGRPGGSLSGMSGSTTATIRMGAGETVTPPTPTCTAPDNGTGTVDLPPPGCGYVSPEDLHMIINGLPAGTTITVGAQHSDFFGVTHMPGGSLGGEVEQFMSLLQLDLNGNGSLAGFHRNLNIQAQCESHVGPRTPGNPVQSFDTDMFRIQGQLPPGDPDFDLLRITAGSGFGLPSPGHTTLTQLPGGQWNVDSFFDITYRIDFVGHPGGALSGMSGSTTGTIRMTNGHPVPPPVATCAVPDNGTGTVTLPPAGCGYLSPADVHMIIDGLPPGTTIELGAEHRDFFNVTGMPGGSLGGEVEEFDSFAMLQLQGTGDLATYARNLNIQLHCQTHTAPRTPGDNIQSFDTQMFMVQGQLPPGDPDFDLLRITAGNGFGMPSPGHTTLTKIPGTASYNIDSFFDITYRIDFVGHPGGPLGGHSGSTTGTIRMSTGHSTEVGAPREGPTAKTVELRNVPNPFGAGTTIQYRLPSAAHVRLTVYDAQGKKVRSLTNERMPAGPHAMMWDARNDDGKKLRSGTYFIKLAIEGETIATRKATLVR